jgi:transcriptional regulator with XRE-family HTH domain
MAPRVPVRICTNGAVRVEWNDEMMARLKEVCASADLTREEKARRLGVSTAALISKLTRLKSKETGRVAKKKHFVPVFVKKAVGTELENGPAITGPAETFYNNMRFVLEYNVQIPSYMERPVACLLQQLAIRTANISPDPKQLPQPVRAAVLETIKKAALAIRHERDLPELPPALCTGPALRGAALN